MKKSIKSSIALSAGVLAIVGLVVAPTVVDAADTTEVTANIGTAASVSSTSGAVAVNITPVIGGSFSSASDTVIAGTNNASGYKLQVSATSTDLVSGVNTIAASSGTPAAPVTLANNTWGYRVDGQYGFGAGPTSAETNAANLDGSWAGITTSPVDIKNVASAVGSDSTTVWYGVGADNTKPQGAYKQTVTYTAVTNP